MLRGLRTCHFLHWPPCSFRLTKIFRTQKAICFGGDWTYQKRVVQLSSVSDEGTMLLASYVKASPVTPYGFMDVALTSLCDTPGWSIETLDPVSMIRRFGSPSISNETVGEQCFSRTENVGLSTAFPWVSRWRELPSRSPLNRFPGYGFPVCLPISWGRVFIAGRAGTHQTPARIPLSRRVLGSCSL